MMKTTQFDAWSAGDAYEHYMGRWSRLIAEDFLRWLAPAPGLDWLDVGCGTGVLSDAILRQCAPASVTGIDPSEGFVDFARTRGYGPVADFRVGDAQSLPADDASFDIVTSGLVLNFIPDPASALGEMRRVLRPGGQVSFYVWDYPGGGMGFIDAFWKAAARLDPKAADLDESVRFPMCTKAGLQALCDSAGLDGVEIIGLEQATEFSSFGAFWEPFTLGAGPAPGYCKSLSEDQRAQLKHELGSRLGTDGPISVPARAWAVKAKFSNS